VENIESVPCEIANTNELLSMLLPNQLKKGTMQFLEVEDLTNLRNAPKPPTTRSNPNTEVLDEKEEQTKQLENELE